MDKKPIISRGRYAGRLAVIKYVNKCLVVSTLPLWIHGLIPELLLYKVIPTKEKLRIKLSDITNLEIYGEHFGKITLGITTNTFFEIILKNDYDGLAAELRSDYHKLHAPQWNTYVPTTVIPKKAEPETSSLDSTFETISISNQKVTFCPICGNKLPDRANFCPTCRNELI